VQPRTKRGDASKNAARANWDALVEDNRIRARFRRHFQDFSTVLRNFNSTRKPERDAGQGQVNERDSRAALDDHLLRF